MRISYAFAMSLRRAFALLTAFWPTFGACSSDARPQDDMQATNLAAASGEVLPARSADPLACPPEQLSCGMRQPVVSDGVRPFRNREMGLQATFPAGSRVCLARSGDAPRGFYAHYGLTKAGCPESGEPPPAHMGIGSSFNAVFYRTLREAAGECGPPSGTLGQMLRDQPLAIRGHETLACQSDEPDGRIELTLHAMAGTWPEDMSEDAPRVLYWVSFGTTPDRLRDDLRTLRRFLRSVRIGLPDT